LKYFYPGWLPFVVLLCVVYSTEQDGVVLTIFYIQWLPFVYFLLWDAVLLRGKYIFLYT